MIKLYCRNNCGLVPVLKVDGRFSVVNVAHDNGDFCMMQELSGLLVYTIQQGHLTL